MLLVTVKDILCKAHVLQAVPAHVDGITHFTGRCCFYIGHFHQPGHTVGAGLQLEQ